MSIGKLFARFFVVSLAIVGVAIWPISAGARDYAHFILDNRIAQTDDYSVYLANLEQTYPISSHSKPTHRGGCLMRRNGATFDALVVINARYEAIGTWEQIEQQATPVGKAIAKLPGMTFAQCASRFRRGDTKARSIRFLVVSDELPRDGDGGRWLVAEGWVAFKEKQALMQTRSGNKEPVWTTDFKYEIEPGSSHLTVRTDSLQTYTGGDLSKALAGFAANPEKPSDLYFRSVSQARQAARTAEGDFCSSSLRAPAVIDFKGKQFRGLAPKDVCKLHASVAGYVEKTNTCVNYGECKNPSPQTMAFADEVIRPALATLAANFSYYLNQSPRDIDAADVHYRDLFKTFFGSTDAFSIKHGIVFYPVNELAEPISPLRRFLTDASAAYVTAIADQYVEKKVPFTRKLMKSSLFKASQARMASGDRMQNAGARLFNYDNIQAYLQDEARGRGGNMAYRLNFYLLTSPEYDRRATEANRKYASYYREMARQKKLEPAIYLLGALMLGRGLGPYRPGAASNVPLGQRKIHTFGYSADDFLLGNPIPTGK
ncbi:hypothetical protein [Qipengyuania aquimaris]|uniref:hypothetical protein n=1 Tax=Qipengyuania aquimaris TaxID=255984 RepID=UPI001CD43DAB|nr:hypothetical protein [Qipengyuania aquimaris]MCA0903901.1 hypothetical protein [Qipengyuania aquimaris]